MHKRPNESVKIPQASGARLIAACTIGNAFEFYDFLIFSFFAATIGKLFFPVGNPTAQLMLALATYGVGFVLRPLGGLLLGAYADRYGRRKATILTLMLMALGTCMIGLAPTYAQAGILGPLVVVVGRLIQGFSAGGEIGASTTLLAESAPPARRGFYGSWQLASQGLAVIVAASAAGLVFSRLPPEAVESWGWRAPFLLGVLIVPVGLWLRSAIGETYAGEAERGVESELAPVGRVVRDYGRDILTGVALAMGGAAANAVVVLYMSTYAVRQLHMPPATALIAGIVSGLMTLLVAPLSGWLSDRYGRKTMPAIASLAMALLIYPGFVILNIVPTLPALIAVVAALSAINAFGGAPALLLLTEIFPARVRATGMALVYAIGVTIFGGFGQFFVTWLIKATGDPLAPAFYVIACVLLAFPALALMRDMTRKTLD